MTRYRPLSPDAMTPEQHRLRDEVVRGARGRMTPPVEVWLRSPGLAEHAQRLGEYCRFRSALPPALSELAILVCASHWQAQFEWWAHARLAREAGVPEAVVAAVRAGTPPPLGDPAATVVYRFSKTLLEERRVPEALFAEAQERLGERGVVDLVGLLGYYALVSLTLNAFEVPVPDNERPFPEPSPPSRAAPRD
jgi:4-carboxymuconolactone decarboxylase